MQKTIFIARPSAALIDSLDTDVDVMHAQVYADAASAGGWLTNLADKADVTNKWSTADEPVCNYDWLDIDDATTVIQFCCGSGYGDIPFRHFREIGTVEEISVAKGVAL
jgi:hypothetical protein